jgi:nitronate monooxygenase
VWTDTEISRRLGIRYPIIQGPMGGGYTTPQLVAAVSNAGGLGSLGAYTFSPEQLVETCAKIRSMTSLPFSVNLWVPQPEEERLAFSDADFLSAAKRLAAYRKELGVADPIRPERYTQSFAAQIEALYEIAPRAFSFTFGIPPSQVLRECHKRNILTIGVATTVDEAVAIEAAGADFVVAAGSEAGGHHGSFLAAAEESLVGTLALVPLVVDRVKIPVIAAGGIADGRGITAALALGAQAAQLGTAFLVCPESSASPSHRAELLSQHAYHTTLTRAFSGRLARAIENRFVKESKASEGAITPYPVQNWLTQPIRQAAGKASRPEFQSLWSGQAAPLIRERTAANLVESLVAETDRVLAQLART